jgi:hypothetical protein
MVFVEPAALNLPVSTSAPSSPRVLGKRLPQSQTPKRPYWLLEPDRRQHGRVSFWRRFSTGRECGQIVPPCIWPGSASVRRAFAKTQPTCAAQAPLTGTPWDHPSLRFSAAFAERLMLVHTVPQTAAPGARGSCRSRLPRAWVFRKPSSDLAAPCPFGLRLLGHHGVKAALGPDRRFLIKCPMNLRERLSSSEIEAGVPSVDVRRLESLALLWQIIHAASLRRCIFDSAGNVEVAVER